MNKKVLVSIFLSLGLIMTFTSCTDSNKSAEKESVQVDKANVLKTVINVEGMTCEGCEASIQNNLNKFPGVVSSKASHVSKTTTIEYDKTKTDPAALEQVIIETGYKIISEEEKSVPKEAPTAMKCGEGKCGAGKCGNAE